MKTLVQKLPLDENSSFIARTYRTPHFETPYHQHSEYELVKINECPGTAFIGDSVLEFKKGDVYLLGGNVPHWFRKKECTMTGSSMVIQFSGDFIGEKMMGLPEMKSVRDLLSQAAKGIYLSGELRKKIGRTMNRVEEKNNFYRLIDLLSMLHDISESDEYHFVSRHELALTTRYDQGMIHDVFEFTMQNFRRKIALEEVAGRVNKSISAFCHYFKKNTKLSYVDFLTQVRISHACTLLKETDLTVTEICYESGFHNWANFSRHFRKLRNISPTGYRERFSSLRPVHGT